MRTTVTLDPDTDAEVRRLMQERGISFKQAVNDAIRQGLADHSHTVAFRTEVRRMGRPAVNLDRALQLAGELEDEELVRRARSPR